MKLNKTLISTLLLATFSTSSYAWMGEERITDVKFGLWSHSYTDEKLKDLIETDENTYGIEIQHFINKPNQKTHWLGVGAAYEKDNYGEDSFHLSGLYKYQWKMESLIDSIDFNLKLSLINRTFRTIDSESNGTVEYSEERETRLALYPTATINFTKQFNTDITYIPEDWGANLTDEYGIFSVKVGYRF